MSRHLITRPVKTADCLRCGAPTLRGLAEGLTATVDPQPIPADTEWRILLNGLRTYTLTPMRKELVYRAHWRIRGTILAGTIHAQHVCVEKPSEPEQMELEFGHIPTPEQESA